LIGPGFNFSGRKTTHAIGVSGIPKHDGAGDKLVRLVLNALKTVLSRNSSP